MSEETPGPSATRMRRMRNYTWFSLVFLSYLAVIPALQIAVDDDIDLATTLALIASAVVAVAQRVRFVNRALRKRESSTGPTVEHVVTFAVAVLTWGYSVTLQIDPLWWCFLPSIVAGGVVLNTPTGRRMWATLAMATCTGVACLAAAPWRQPALEPRVTWVLAGLSVAFVVALILLDVTQVWFWDTVLELDRSRTMAEELAVTRERLRFAADLHDIQGHHLQAIMLKGELAERLIGRDNDAARTQASELTELARTALTDTRRVVHGYRGTTLKTEITNAVDILGAAGIDAEVRGESHTVPPPLQSLFGALVREGTTNILRHSQATRCELTLRTDGETAHVRLVNDGITPQETRPGSGIESLRERFTALGGDVYARVVGAGDDATFELGGHAPTRR
ncbi:histidine kinase [Saccharomonospora sp.]|uniref:sensor histidine kinase n=1 Tax=Saccharomonospora sp. TaxID=33913 RepID=UPI0026291513|nr:histidine kinase [Saccharomonospora sp.]